MSFEKGFCQHKAASFLGAPKKNAIGTVAVRLLTIKVWRENLYAKMLIGGTQSVETPSVVRSTGMLRHSDNVKCAER